MQGRVPGTLRIFFDVDFTLLSTEGRLRPGTHEVFERLGTEGHQVFVWSGVGLRTEEVAEHRLSALVHGIFAKPQGDLEEELVRFGVPFRPDFVVDDDPRIVRHFGGLLVEPYYFEREGDRELEMAAALILDFARTRHLEHPAYHAGRHQGTGQPRPDGRP